MAGANRTAAHRRGGWHPYRGALSRQQGDGAWRLLGQLEPEREGVRSELLQQTVLPAVQRDRVSAVLTPASQSVTPAETGRLTDFMLLPRYCNGAAFNFVPVDNRD